MGLYCRNQEIISRVAGKVKFTDDIEDENSMSYRLLARLINEAEGELEFDLSPRYYAPFQTREGRPFSELPERPTKEMLRTLAELKAVIRVLETDFGMGGGSVNSEDYVKTSQKRYNNLVNKLTKRRDDDQNQWFYPPLKGLLTNTHNNEADDGFRGMILTTNNSPGQSGDYASDQVNDPSKSYFIVATEDLYDNGGSIY